MNLRDNMQQAWRHRRYNALVQLSVIDKAPAFFTPECVERAAADYQRANAEIARWSA